MVGGLMCYYANDKFYEDGKAKIFLSTIGEGDGSKHKVRDSFFIKIISHLIYIESGITNQTNHYVCNGYILGLWKGR